MFVASEFTDQLQERANKIGLQPADDEVNFIMADAINYILQRVSVTAKHGEATVQIDYHGESYSVLDMFATEIAFENMRDFIKDRVIVHSIPDPTFTDPNRVTAVVKHTV